MEQLVGNLSGTDCVVVILSSVLTFLLGRFTTYVDDRRKGMKEINDTFYKPFLSMYLNEHHAYALEFVDLPIEVQSEMVRLLLENADKLSPVIKQKIQELDMCYSGYVKILKKKKELLGEEKEDVEKIFSCIYQYIEKEYIRNERKLYCTFIRYIWYNILDCFLKVKNHIKG